MNVEIRKRCRLSDKFDRGSNEFKVAKDWIADRISEYRRLVDTLQKLEKKKTGIQLTKVQINTEGLPHMPHLADGRGFPHFYSETYLLNRGDVTQKRDKVEAGFLRVLMRNNRQQKEWEVAKRQVGIEPAIDEVP